jgi:LmbE family N-acetylglucosaminyl deacetylase
MAAGHAAADCDNESLTDFERLLILAPHPDDEVLGFAGLADAFRRQGKPVETVVVTDGDGYCDACTLWNSGSIHGPGCDAATLSNFDTPEADSFAETRRLESTAAAAVLGLPRPEFLGYPDTGIGAAWSNWQAGAAEKPLRRSDFSMCADCDSCAVGYGGGPETDLDAQQLRATLTERLATTDERTLIATTHWMDSHADHGGLGHFVMEIAGNLGGERNVVFSVIHAHTPAESAFPDCWYPGPAAADCPCFHQDRADNDPGWLAAARKQRFDPEAPQSLPGDADYGEPLSLCLDPALYEGHRAGKLQAVESYASQLGTAGRVPGLLPESRKGLMDCSGYLLSFVRRTEVFVLRSFGSNAIDAGSP